MKDVKPLILDIPEPCFKDPDEMIPVTQGRFCAHCQKTVIDFSGWSDTELYEFFNSDRGPVCGFLLNTQLNQSIQLSPQKPTLLSRIALAMGLTLVMTHAAIEVTARLSPPLVGFIPGLGATMQIDTTVTDNVFEGIVFDERRKRFEGVIVLLKSKEGKLIGSMMTDKMGAYKIRFSAADDKQEDLILEFFYSGYIKKVYVDNQPGCYKVYMKKNPGPIIMGGVHIIRPRIINNIDVINPSRYGY